MFTRLTQTRAVRLCGITKSVAAASLAESTGVCQQMATPCSCLLLIRRSPGVLPGRFLPVSMRWTRPLVKCAGTRPVWLTATASRRFQSVIKACLPRLPALISWYLPVAWTATSMLTTASRERSSGHSILLENSNRCRAIRHWEAPSSLMAPCCTRGTCS